MAFKPKSDIARATKAALRGGRPDDRGLLHGDAQSFDVAISPGSVERAVTIVDRLIGLLREGGLPPTIEQVDYRTKHLKLDGEVLKLRLAEELDRTRHVPTKEEQARLEERFHYPRVPAWDYQPTGRLSLTVAPAQYGQTETWTDRPEAPIEDAFPRIIKVIRQLVITQRTQRTEVEQRARLSAEREHARYEAEARERKRREYRSSFVAEARRWQEAALLRDYARELQVEAAGLADLQESEPLAGFIEDLLEASDAIDPIPGRLGAFVESAQAAAADDEAVEPDDDDPAQDPDLELEPDAECEPSTS